MPWQGAPMHVPQGPALFLYPNNDSFVPKMISLVPSGNRVKIGRQTNAKTMPGERNGYFDSKVLSRQHAEVWEEGGKIYIKDVKSSNGTFVNGERLSVEGVESDPWELKSDDRVEFGIDIVGEDNKTIIHHKVAATVHCVLTPEDYAQLPVHQPPQHHLQHQNGYHPQAQQQRRPSVQQVQNPGGLGGMGGGPSLGLSGRSGKSGLTFDHILGRLQTELQKSREAGSDLHGLAGVMTDINETLAGGAAPPSHNPNSVLPPVRPPKPTAPQSTTDSNISLTSLQSQLIQTQSSLASHVDKVKSLETVVAEHEQVKRDVQLMRDLMEQRKREMDSLLTNASTSSQSDSANSHNPALANGKRRMDDGHDDDDDDDDSRSVITVVPEDNESPRHDGYSQEERDRDDEEDRRARSAAMRRPRTPEPHGLDEDDEDAGATIHRQLRPQFDSTSLMPPSSTDFSTHVYSSPQIQHTLRKSQPAQNGHISNTELHSQNALLSTRLETLTNQLGTALDLSRKLQSQAEAAQSNIERLQAKVESLEAFVEKTKAQQQQQQLDDNNAVSEVQERPSVSTEVWDSWRGGIEGEWRVEREEWETERRRLKDAVREWEGRMDELEVRERERAAEEKEILDAIKREREAEKDGWDHRDDDEDEDSSSSYPPDLKPQLNGILNHSNPTKRRIAGSSKSSKLRKRRTSPVAPVATPPHSPTLNGDALDHLSEASGSRPPSPAPALSPHVKGMTEVFGNGHALARAKRDMLPISPAPSVRYGTRAGSAESDPDVVDDGHNETSDQVRPETSGMEKPYVIRHAQMGDSPLPYVSAAGVVLIGLAAWAVVASRLKD